MVRRIILVAALAGAAAYFAIGAAAERLSSQGFEDACSRQARIVVMTGQINPFNDYDPFMLAQKFNIEVAPLRNDADLIADDDPQMARLVRQQAEHLSALSEALQTKPGTKELPSEAVRVAKEAVKATSKSLVACRTREA
ncbi:MAG: hypothetical protein ACRDIU_06850 [Actinomycetota bacterium]